MFENALVESMPVLIAMVIGLVMCVMLFVWHVFLIAIGDKRSLTLMNLGVAMYGIGLICKVLMIGPEFLRWYVADIGFPAAVGLFLSLGSEVLNRNKVAAMSERDHTDWVLFNRQFMLIYAGILSIGYEFVTGFLYARSDLEVSSVGSTDPIDILMYVTGVATALWFVRREKRIIQEQRLEEDAQIAKAAEKVKQARHEARKQTQRTRSRATSKRKKR